MNVFIRRNGISFPFQNTKKPIIGFGGLAILEKETKTKTITVVDTDLRERVMVTQVFRS